MELGPCGLFAILLLISAVAILDPPGLNNDNYPDPSYYGTRYLDFDAERNDTVAFYFSNFYSIGSDESLWIADPHEHTVKRVRPGNFLFPQGTIDLIAGQPNKAGNRLSDANSALFNRPMSVVFTSIVKNNTDGLPQETDVLFIADSLNHCIKMIDLETAQVDEWAGKCEVPGFQDGPPGTNRLNTPETLGLDGENNLYLLDAGNRHVRKINEDKVVHTLVGGAWRSTDWLRAEGISWSAAPFYDISNSPILDSNIIINVMICNSDSIAQSGPQLFIPEELWLKHDTICGNRIHPLVFNLTGDEIIGSPATETQTEEPLETTEPSNDL